MISDFAGVFRASFDPGNMYADWMRKWLDPTHYSHGGRYTRTATLVVGDDDPNQWDERKQEKIKRSILPPVSDDDEQEDETNCASASPMLRTILATFWPFFD